MKKPTTLKLVLAVLLCIQSFVIHAQKNFTPRFDTSLKGDMLLIGNNILNRDNNRDGERANDAYNVYNRNNNDLQMYYVDVDNDNSTFSSSSATLSIPSGSRECYKIVYAGLYWAGIYSQGSIDNKTVNRSNLGSIKIKLPNQAAYTDISGQLIYDYYPSNSNGSQIPYAYYYDLTSLVQGLANPEGEYTVANIISAQGNINGGFSAGWNLFVVYEDPKSSAKYITTFDGFRWIQANSNAVTYTISGFKTIPTGTVKAKLAFAALEGDVNLPGDRYSINNTDISTAERPVDNFFNSTINDTNGPFTNRNPASGNTLGFEAGILNVPNPANRQNPGGSVIKNNDTSATLKLTTSGDGYGLFFNAFNVEIIEPKIVLTKIVKNAQGVNIGGQNVTLGQQLNYEIGFKNTGNDNATSFTIRDQLPINIIFNYPSDIVSLPTGVTVQSYDATTRNIVFKVDNSVVKVGDPEKVISFKVQVVPDCHMLSEACSNSIDNSAYATYKGTQNTAFTISDDPSVNTNTGCILIPKATNFLVGVDGCKYTDNVTLCGESINLTAANGYTDYTWYSDEARTQLIGKGQTLNVKNPGTYYVYNLAAAPCRSIYQSFVVTRFGTTVENPVIPFADQVVICSNDGKKLPNIFLCGGNASRAITLNISDANSIVWEKLNESSCTAVTNQNCANESTSCTWTRLKTGSSYTANQAGQFRVTLNYAGGCFNRFYFNVYSNSLTPTETHKDIICGAPGSITIGGVPAGYEYAISTDPNGTPGAYQTSNVFPITSPNSYTVHIRQIGVTTNPCIFTVPGILIRSRDLSISTTVTQPTCKNDKGSIKVGAQNIDPQYYYYIYTSGGTLVNSFGPTSNSDYTFANLSSGDYRVRVTNGAVGSTPAPSCDKTVDVTINPVPAGLNPTAALTVPLTACSNGKIVVTTTGGTAPYYHFINGSSTFQLSNEIAVTGPGTYDIRVVDANNCSGTTSITVNANPKPTYTVTATEINCSGGTSQINVNVTNANGYTLQYSIDNGATFSNNPVFPNVTAGTYNVVVRYTMSGVTCTDPATPITITQPANALSASAGVSELAGCDPSGNGFGKVRITNPQGGTPPYTYSFDGGANYGSSNEAYVAPGTYTLYIKDAKGCIFSMPGVVLDPRPTDPTISVAPPVFNCNGTATSTVTVTSGGGNNYAYEYYLDNVKNTNTPSNVFVNVPSGPHTISVRYNLTSVPTYSNLLLEDFGSGGTTTTPGIASAYCFNDQRVNPPYTCSLNGTPTRSVEDNQYSVTSFFWRNDNAWYHFKDHTTNGADANGRYLLVNIGGAAGNYGVLYSKPIIDVIPNQPVMVSLYVGNLLNTGVNGAAPIVRFELVNAAGQVVATEDTGKIAEAANDPNRTKWVPINISLNPGPHTNLTFRIRSGSIEYGGNDIVIDDIWVRQIPKSCITQKDFPIVIDSNKAFTVSEPVIDNLSCSNSSDGRISIDVANFNTTTGYKYSLNNGTTWNTATVSPLVITGLTAGTYRIIVKSDDAGTCSSSFTKTITAPVALTTTANVTVQPTCTMGASITATASGGTPNYKYELRRTDGTVVVGFQNNNVFTNVATGNYVVVVQDASSCSSPASSVVSVVAPQIPTATLASNSDLCYDTTNRATLVVTASGGKTPYSYSLDGAPGQLSNTFTNVGPGTHSIVVTDANGCTAPAISNIVIANQLKAEGNITKPLDCITNNAEITITVTGGTSPYTYAVAVNGSTTYTTIPSNVYTASSAGRYVFRVTDSKGCIVFTDAVVVDPIANPTVTVYSTQITCNGLTNGSVQLVGAGGSGGYQYNFNNAGWSSTSLYTNLSPNIDYTYLVRDSKGCTSAIGTIRLTQPTALSGTISATELQCNGTGTTPAVVTVNGAGGTGAYTYSFNGTTNFTSTNTFSISTGGVVTAYIRDANNCQFGPLSVTINNLDRITGITITDSGYDCSTTPPGGHVNIAAVKTDISAPIRFQIISGPAGYNSASNSDGEFKSLAPGNYVFQATDIKSGCSFTVPYTVKGAPDIVATGSVLTNIQCYGGTGTLQFIVNGVKNRGYDYVITNGGGTIIQEQKNVSETTTVINVTAPQPAGTYTITAIDRLTKCQSTFSVTLAQPSSLVSFTATASNINCNNDNSQITVTATGGTPNYTYAFAKSPSTVPSSAYGNSAILTVDTNSGADLVWDVYVKDNNGCTAKRTITILPENVPTIDTPASQCYTGSPINITITGTYIGTPTFSKDGIFYQQSPNFSLTPGTYTLHLRDGFGCDAQTTYVVAPQLTITPTIVPDATCTPNTTISLSSSGGTGTRSYQVSFNGGAYTATTSPYVATAAGTYKFRVSDSANPVCYAETADITVTLKPTTLTITTAKVDVLCNGNNTGSITITPTSGKAPFTYSVTRGGTSVSTTATTTGLTAGTYDILVTDALGCTSAATSVTISQPTVLDTNATATSFKCDTNNAKQSALVTINIPTAPTAGTAPYTYSFNNGSFTSSNTLTVVDNGNDQTIYYAVKDANGCIMPTKSIVVNKLNPPVIASVNASLIYCAPVANTTSTATITLKALTGIAPFVYEIVSGPTSAPSNTTASFSNLTPGNYVFKVTDASGCYDTFPLNIAPAKLMIASATKLNDVYCNGDSTGSIRYNVSGFTGTYSYSLNSGTPVTGQTAPVFTISNLAPGTYTVVFTDETTRCDVTTATITISQPAAPLSGTVAYVNANCNIPTAKVTITAAGGTPAYQYSFSNSSTVPGTYDTANSANLNPALTWYAWIKDSNECTVTLPLTLVTDTTPIVSASVANQCTASGNNFQIVAVGSNGVAPYTYSINTGVAPSPANTFTVSAGTYTITVKDANNCTNTTTVTVNAAMIAEAILTKDLTCSSPTDATIAVSVTGGAAPFGYRVKVGAGAYTGAPIAFAGTSFIYTTSTAGVYQFEITDANGCPVQTKTATVSDYVPVGVTIVKVDPTCNGSTDGTIRFTNPAGQSPFQYSIDNGVTFGNLAIYGGLASGTYNYVVRDAKGCEYRNSIILNNPPPIVANIVEHGITCGATTPGSLDINVVSGGTAPYTYYLYDNAMTQIATYTESGAAGTPVHNFGGLMFGNYYITVIDANGCKFESNRLRIEPPPYLALTSRIAGATCADGVSVTVNVTGGTPNFVYTIYGVGTTSGSTSATSYTFDHLDQNTTYVFEVVDAGGCPSYLEVLTPTISPIVINSVATTNVTCNGAANGTINFTVSNYNATRLDFEVRDNVTNVAIVPPVSGSATGLTGAPYSGTLTGLRPGNYTLYVKEFDGSLCSNVSVFRITQPAQPLDASITSNVNANCDDPAQVTIRVTGGTGPYTFASAVAPATPSVFASGNVLSLDPGPTGADVNWNIIVKDAQDCEFPLSVTIAKDPSPEISLSVANNCAAEGAFGVVVTETAAGVGPYSIKVDTGVFVSIPGLPYTVTNLSSGSHTITIKDGNDCTDTETININAPLKLTPAITALPSCVVNNGVVTLTPSGGTNSYSYSITPMHPSIVISGNTISGLRADTYTITMTDNGNLCTTTAEVTLPAGTPVTFDAVVTDVSCFNGTNGKIEVNLLPSNDNPTYTYAISPMPVGYVQTGNVFSNLPQGVYDITVTSGRGCSLTKQYTVGQPAILDATPAITAYACNPSNIAQPAVVTITATGGTGPYRFNFDGGATYYTDNTTQVQVSTSAQTVNYYVIDANGCQFNGNVVVPPYQPLTDILFTLTTAPICPTNVADVTLTVTGGYTPYAKYEIISPITLDNGNNATFTGLAPNTYLFKVTDNNGCSIERPYKVEPVIPIDIVLTSSNNVSCNTANGTDNNGSATFTVSDFSASGNYNISVTTNPAALSYNVPTVAGDVITLTGLEAGTYTVTVRDITTTCSKSANVTITMPAPIAFTATASKVFCSDDESEITVTNVTGGTSAYTYAVVKTGDPTPTVFGTSSVLTVDTNLTDLTWDVYVKDANGCISVAVPVTVISNAAPNLNLPAQQCFVGANLTVDLNALSTTYNGVKSFTVDGLAITGTTATFTAAGTYKIILTDDNGCTDEVDYIIQPQLIASASVTKDLYCAAPIDATIDVEISGGVGPYTYQMYHNGAATGPVTGVAGNFTASVSTDGDYYFVITDSNAPACSVTTTTVTVNPTVIPTLAQSQINVSCYTFNDGSLTVVPTGGRLPYTFVLTGPIVNTTGDATGTYTGLIAGTYTVVATDSKNCASAPATFVISEPTELTAIHAITPNTTCSTTTSIVVTATGGTTDYRYNFNGQGYDTANTFSVVNDGSIPSITYTVRDANGCETAPVTVPIVPLNKPTDLTFSASVVTCRATTSTVDVTATNGVGALTFEIISFNGAPAAYAPVNTADNTVAATFTGLVPGDYMFRVTDSNGCTYEELLPIAPVTNIVVNGQTIADMTCNTTNDGQVTFTVSDFAGSYTYTIDKDGTNFVPSTSTTATTIPLTGLAFGQYTINITDNATGCTATSMVEVKQPTVVTVNLVDNVNANCKTGAIVTVQASGGTPGYVYSFVHAGDPAGAFDALATRELDATVPAWDVYAQDANGCISAPFRVNIVTDPLPTGFTAAAVSQCPSATGTYDIVITPGTGMGPFEYSIGSGFQSGLTFTVSVPKTYDLTVRDKFGCEFVFNAAVTIIEPLDIQNTVVDLTTCANGDGSVSATATGGTGNYSYTIDGTTTVTTTPAIFAGLSVGSHTIVVTDLTTTCTKDIEFKLEPATLVTGFDATSTPVTCNGGNNGTITATLDAPSAGVNDNPIYTYTLTGTTVLGVAVNRPAQPENVFENLEAGSYTVTVTSGRGCSDFKLVQVIEPALIVVPNPAIAQYGCTSDNTSNFATITISGVTGGSGTYIYEFIRNGAVVYKGDRNVYTETDYLGGSYTVNVYDNNGCIGSNAGTYVINPFISLDDITISITNAITCTNNEDIAVTVATTGGTPANLQYAITDASGNAVAGNPNNATGIFTNLSIGNYIISVTNLDTNCTIKEVHYVNDPNTFEIKAVPASAQICYGAADGQVTLTFVDRQPIPSDEAGAFSYVITGPVSSTGTTTGAVTTISNLTAGQYTVSATLIGNPYCTVTTLFTIEQPSAQLAVTTTQADITCNPGNNDGEIYASANGGWDNNYQYQLVLNGAIVVDYSTQYTFTGLSAGTYTINVKDGKGCIATTTATLVVPSPITFTATPSATLLSCFGDKTATITVSVPTGGQGSNYMYTLNTVIGTQTISSGPQSSNIFDGLGAGTYSIKVTDGFNCEATSASIVITEPTEVIPNLILASSQTCNVQSTLTLSATGGVGPYSYSTDPSFATNLGTFNSSVTFSVPVGTYQYYVRDTNNCVSFVSNEIKIDPLVPLTVDLDITNAIVKCTGEATGVIVAEAKGGLGNYSYTLQDAAGNPIQGPQSYGRFENLLIGTYKVKVDSGDCSSTSVNAVITEPATALIATFTPTNVSCFGENNGKIVITASGGTGVIKYAISPDLNQFDFITTFDRLAPGTYTVIAQDENGCYVRQDVEITQPNPVIVTEVPNSMIPEVCDGDKDGAFSIEVKGGTLPYSVSLDNEKGPFTQGTATQTIFDFTNLAGGTHTVYVKDAEGCVIEFVENMPNAVILNPTAEVTYDCVNNTQANMVVVTIDASITNPADVDYSLDNNGVFQPSNIFTNVPAGDHFIVARHTNGCEVPTPIFTVNAVAELGLIDITNQSKDINTIVVQASGGVAPYEYSFNGEPFSSSNSYRIYKTGDYVVIVRDKNGCEKTITVHGTFYDFCMPNYFTPNGDGQNDTIGPDCGALAYKELTFDIYDRYGRVVAKYRVNGKWDGRYHGDELPTGDYWYVLKLNDPKDPREFVGHFTLYR
ncbi:T9SS type B sorting domain-containing protein [Flavobacterium sp. F52]|uniref:T9SS type B sorting domain-containing protein n=1 Tax=Flavobacterium sp. F52 TaxID=1202532 RepID=UPI000273899D|nr:T9SS type B sorting domain-containing protein [Flavobacterium sp. F52]EJG00928.1 putative hemagglutinin/hemolysin-like protein [Flavobacterium sp. F52]